MLEAVEVGSEVSKADYEARVPQLRIDLINAQYDLRKADFPVVLLISGDDRIGVIDMLQVLHEWMDARYLPTYVFGEPTDEEKARPRFWRYWKTFPGDGQCAVYLGGWVTAGLRERILGDMTEDGLDRLIEHTRSAEHALVEDGALILKFWLHLPKKEFRKQLKRAKKDPDRDWRVDERDWEIYEHYDEVMPLLESMIRATSTGEAPWFLVESTDARYRKLTVASTILSALQERLAASSKPAKSSEAAAPQRPTGTASVLDRVDLSSRLEYEDYRDKLEKLQGRLARLSRRAHRKGIASVLVFEGWDAAGKGGVIRRITRAMDPQDYHLIPIAAPTDEELAHHYLWRFWRRIPRDGQMAIFDRSWYGRVLVERVEGLTPLAAWRRAYEEINDFESQSVEHGSVVLKFWLHIDPETQLERFKAREQTGYKKYKITEEDYRNRERWDDYVAAVDEMVARTSSQEAPWHLVPANNKRWARIDVLQTLCDALKKRLD